MIYFVQSVDGGDIKIGTTIHLSRRKRALELKHKTKLVVLGVAPGSHERETEWHHRFSKYRRHGEWFESHDGLIRFIRDRATEWDGIDEVECPALVAFKCHQDYKDHLQAVAERERLDIATIIDKALVAYMQSNGYEPMPKR